jgi:hypothetical protein
MSKEKHEGRNKPEPAACPSAKWSRIRPDHVQEAQAQSPITMIVCTHRWIHIRLVTEPQCINHIERTRKSDRPTAKGRCVTSGFSVSARQSLLSHMPLKPEICQREVFQSGAKQQTILQSEMKISRGNHYGCLGQT